MGSGRRSAHVFELGLTVLRSHWRLGVGSAMMDKMIREAREAIQLTFGGHP